MTEFYGSDFDALEAFDPDIAGVLLSELGWGWLEYEVVLRCPRRDALECGFAGLARRGRGTEPRRRVARNGAVGLAHIRAGLLVPRPA
jgi:hypothetical protein